ncbi:MAG: proton-conducting transporter membrane subunit [Chloroflexota bacterium]
MDVSQNLLAAPIVIPMIMASLSLVIGRVGQQQIGQQQVGQQQDSTAPIQLQRWLAMIAVLLNLGVAILILQYTVQGHRLVLQMGLWDAPFGITVLADALSAIMLTLTGILAVAIVPFAAGTLDKRERMNFYPVLLFLLMGVNGAFLSGDLFNLYVFFEVLLMASFVLLTLGGQTKQINGGLRYVVLNLLGSLIFLSAAAIAYGTLGTLNMAQMAQRVDSLPPSTLALLGGLLLVAYSSKAGLFPLYFWLPSSYHVPHPAITAFFGGLLTKVGVYTLLRIFPLIFPTLLQEWRPLILTVAGLTMLAGVLGAMALGTIRRVLSFQIISHVGYMIMGLGLAFSNQQLAFGFGIAAAILYLIHHMIAKTALLMAGGTVELEMASGSLLRKQLGGLVTRRSALAVLFFCAAFSLAGVPPFSGFVSKLGLLQIALDSEQWLIAGVSVAVSVLTMINMAQLWQKVFWGEPDPQKRVTPNPNAPLRTHGGRLLTLTPIAMLVILSLTIGVFSGTVFRWSTVAAEQVLDREGYIADVGPTDEIIYMEYHGDKEHSDKEHSDKESSDDTKSEGDGH